MWQVLCEDEKRCGWCDSTPARYTAEELWQHAPANLSPIAQESLLSDGPQHQPFSLLICAALNPMLFCLDTFMCTGLYISTTALILSAFMCAGINIKSILTSSHAQYTLASQPGGPLGPCTSSHTYPRTVGKSCMSWSLVFKLTKTAFESSAFRSCVTYLFTKRGNCNELLCLRWNGNLMKIFRKNIFLKYHYFQEHHLESDFALYGWKQPKTSPVYDNNNAEWRWRTVTSVEIIIRVIWFMTVISLFIMQVCYKGDLRRRKRTALQI